VGPPPLRPSLPRPASADEFGAVIGRFMLCQCTLERCHQGSDDLFELAKGEDPNYLNVG
jgi:hypothetical protein